MYKDSQQKMLADMRIQPALLKEYDNAALVDLAVAKNVKLDDAKVDLDLVKTEIQRRAEGIIQDKNVKFTEFFGAENTGWAAVVMAQSLDILNFQRLQNGLGDEFIGDKIKKKEPEIKYDVEPKFKRALISVVTGDYCKEFTLSEILDKSGWNLDSKQKSLLIKKLKGEHNRDKTAILNVLGKRDGEIDIDVELFYIYKIKNWELIQAYFDTERFQEVESLIRKCIMVDETPKIGIKYDN